MSVVKVKKGHVILPCGKKIVLYKTKDGVLRINPRFLELWTLLWWTESYININYPAIRTCSPNYALPKRSTSFLKSSTTTKDNVRVWDLLSANGPVTTGGVNLSTPTEGIYYKVSWKMSKQSCITFYSEYVASGHPNGSVVPMLDVQGNIATFHGDGEFTTFDYDGFYVSSKSKEVELCVEVVIPKGCVDCEKVPSTIYLFFKYAGQGYKFPVYKLRQDGIYVDVVVAKNLRCLRALIQRTLLDMSVALPVPPSAVAGSPTSNVVEIPATLFIEIASGVTGYVTVYESGTDILTFWAFELTYLSPVIFPEERYQKRWITYNVRVNPDTVTIGTRFSVRLFKKDYGRFVPQRHVTAVGSWGAEILTSYTYSGQPVVSDRFMLEFETYDAVLIVTFEDPVGINAASFLSIDYQAEQWDILWAVIAISNLTGR